MNNINFNVSNTSHSSSISLIDEVSNSNISFFISDTALYSKDIKDTQLDSLVTAYDLDNKAILEATTYSNSLLLGVNTLNETDIQTEANIELISEDRNRIAVKSNDELIAQITAIKVIDEAGKELRSSMHIQENGIELVIEEEMTKATVTIEFAPYTEFEKDNMQHLIRIDDEDYWAEGNKIYKSNILTEEREEYCKTNCSLSSTYSEAPQMISKDIYYKRQTGFFRIANGSYSSIKSNTEYYMLKWLYGRYYIGMKVLGQAAETSAEYDVLTIDLDTLDIEVIATHSIALGSQTYISEYLPMIVQNNSKEIVFSLHRYDQTSDLPSPGYTEMLSFVFNKETLEIEYCDIPAECVIGYKDENYLLYSDIRNGGIYLNGEKISGLRVLLKPLSKIQDDILSLHSYSYNMAQVSRYYELNLATKIIDVKNEMCKRYSAVSDTIILPKKTSTELLYKKAYVLLHDEENLNKRSYTSLSTEDINEKTDIEVYYGSITIPPGKSVFINPQRLLNKRLFISSDMNLSILQNNKYLYNGQKIINNHLIELKNETMSQQTMYLSANAFIIDDNYDLKLIDFNFDTRRLPINQIYNLPVKGIDKVDGKYSPEFESYGQVVEDFESDLKLRWRTNYGEEPFEIKEGPNGTICGFMGSTSSSARLWSEFTTIAPRIEFDYLVSSEKNYDWFRVYINGAKVFEASGTTMTSMEHLSFDLDQTSESIIRFAYENDTSGDHGESGYYIDNITANAKVSSTTTEIDFETVDYGVETSLQAVNIKFNDLEISDNVEQAIYYSTNAGTSWTLFKGSLPNEDNILLKAVFTKPTIDEEAYVRFSSVTVMPGELDWITNIDTNRKIYDTSDIIPELIENITVSKDEDNRYNLDFTPEVEVIETFDKDYKVIDYTLESGKYGTVELVSEGAYSGGKCLRYTWNYDYNVSLPSQGRMTFKTKATQLKFMAKLVPSPQTPLPTRLKGNVYIDIDGVYTSYSISNSGNFEEYTYNLNLTKESTVTIGYTSPGSERSDILIDNITLVGETVTLNVDPYIETEAVDLSIFPSDITCELVTDDLQSSHDLNTQYFYTINDGQDWIEFNKTLPNSSNVRLKAVFTKDTEEEVIASFKNLIIRQDDGSTIKATIRLATTRTVHASNDKSYETSREVVNTANPVVHTERQVLKDIDMTLTTNRKTAINDETTILTQREVVRVNTVKRSLDTIRHIHKSLINSLNTTRNISNNTSSMVDTKVVVTNTKEAVIDTERQVWSIIEVDKRIDTTRIVYITASSFVTQLNIDLKLSKGTLLLDNQEFN